MGQGMQKEKRRPLRKDDISVFWKHMLMMLGILLISLIGLLAIHQISLSILTRENLDKMQIALGRDCEAMATEIYSSISIPETIERTKHYEYLRTDNDGVLDQKNYPLLDMIRTTLNGLSYHKSLSSECALYLKGTNSIAAASRGVAVAEDYFTECVIFAESDSDEILMRLKENGSVYVLPIQEITDQHAGRIGEFLPVILAPRDKRISILTLYSQQTILEELGIQYFPEGTYVELVSVDGEQIAAYPQAVTEEIRSGSHMLKGSLGVLNVNVTVWVPKSHFNEVAKPIRSTATVMILLVMATGFLLAAIFSKASVAPIRKLIQEHGDKNNHCRTNEIAHLDRLLSGAQEKTAQMQELLARQILARAMSGGILSEWDERQLKHAVPLLSDNYRVVILHSTQKINEVLDEHLRQYLGDAFWTLISDEETGLIISDDETQMNQLTNTVNALIQQAKPEPVLCGVSSPTNNHASLHKAVRQARAALPQEDGIKLFPGDQITSHAISWLQHERLYQSIFSNAEEDAMRLLRSIAKNTNHSNAREVFYNVRFVIHSAAEELDIPFPERQELEYRPDRLPQYNIKGLESMLHLLFSRVREKNEDKVVDEQMAVLDYIQKNLNDYELCAATVGMRFGLVEQRVYKIVRNQTGQSFGEYLHQQRMKQAAALLYSTKLSNAEVAEQCGYRIASTFYRQFKEHYGISPGQYRRDNDKSAEPEEG